MKRGKIRKFFIPTTILGKWSIGLIIIFFLLLAYVNLIVALGQRGGNTFFSNPLISIPMFLAGISAIASFFTGIISIIKNKERSLFVFVSILIGLFVLFFVIGEILVPH